MINDVVSKFESLTTSIFGGIFAYGSESHLNLIEGDMSDNIHLLLFPVQRRAVFNGLILSVHEVEYTGKFLLVVPSDFANHYYNEGDGLPADSKYTLNIKPLISNWVELGNQLASCEGYDVINWSNVDAINVLDANKDGLWCNFTIRIDLKSITQ